MPILPSSLVSLNEKVNSARKGFNSTIDRAGERTGVFKPSSSSSSSSKPSGFIVTNSNSSSSNPTHYLKPPPPPPPRQNLPPPPPPPQRQNLPPPPPQRQNPAPPPPPRRTQTHQPQSSYDQSIPPPPPISKRPTEIPYQHQQSHDPPPPPITPYRQPPPGSHNGNGYGPPTILTPVQPTSRYGPPSPPQAPIRFDEEERQQPPQTNPSNSQQPQPPKRLPPPVSLKKPNLNPVKSYTKNEDENKSFENEETKPQALNNPPRHQKRGQIPFPPFSKFTESDKLAFFELLDEFFGQKYPDQIPKGGNSRPTPGNINKPPSALSPPPPRVTLNTRPSNNSFISQPPVGFEDDEIRARSVAIYINRSNQWNMNQDQWYNSDDPVPRPVQGSTDVKRMSAWTQTGNVRIQKNYILFSDLSQLWSSVKFDVNRPFPPRSVEARYRPGGKNFNREKLIQSSETYGSFIVQFGLEAESRQSHVGRGECWDLANEALKSFHDVNGQRFSRGSLPMTTVSRTHGVLIYHGISDGSKDGYGEWKEVEDLGKVRPGDIIEWKLAKCDTINPKYTCTLGDPEHTAIIIEATESKISTGKPSPPQLLGNLTVIEQSLNQLPIRRTYDLSSFKEGELWIYRAMSLEDLLGVNFDECEVPVDMIYES